eukprot:TRINITY_DN1708_c0_g1_i2.p1 TRINITY_DN1708_c0_g1~~TRINITY_DN1708_c0_g1_i2.p1  ORF type:complete len:216 (-),score=52.20 TRINITY_DN1708_c0_g1_i2:32-679(-)
MDTCQRAVNLGIYVNAVQCGSHKQTKTIWEQISTCGKGAYIAVDSNDVGQNIATPMDEEMGELYKKLQETSILYGSAAQQAENRRIFGTYSHVTSEVLYAKSSVMSSRKNTREIDGIKYATDDVWTRKGDLVQDIADGSIKLEDITLDVVDGEYQSLEDLIEKTNANTQLRAEIQKQIASLNHQRDIYIKESINLETDNFDQQMKETILAQTKVK